MLELIHSYPQAKLVNTFQALANEVFEDHVNALCWYRHLDYNFKEIVEKLTLIEDITEISIAQLEQLKLSDSASKARDVIIYDITLLTELGASPSLNLIKEYQRDEELDFISTDVYSFHIDRSPLATDTYLCTYYGAASDIISNDQVEQKIHIPEIRQKIKSLFDGEDHEFDDFLEETYMDLHYQPKNGATPLNLGIGHLWRLAVDHPDQKVLPCVHRAPKENAGELRLLLIC